MMRIMQSVDSYPSTAYYPPKATSISALVVVVPVISAHLFLPSFLPNIWAHQIRLDQIGVVREQP